MARPVAERLHRRLEGFELGTPTEHEMQDAIAVLRDAPTWEKVSDMMGRMATEFQITPRYSLAESLLPLIEEAERIHQEGAVT
jgi:hypothetical protein